MTVQLPDLFQVTRVSEVGVSHVADNLVVLQYLRGPAGIRRTLTVLKTRASLHEPQVREFTITPAGITLGGQAPSDAASRSGRRP
jgi:circadian clock protein KaiC